MADTKKSMVDIRMTQKSLDDVRRFRQEWTDSVEAINQAITDMKKLQGLTKTLQRNAIAQNLGGYQTGLASQQRSSVYRTSLLGQGKDESARNLKSLEQAERRRLGFIEQQEKRRKSISLNLQTERRSLRQITDLETLREKKMLAQQRVQIEAGKNNIVSLRQARQLTTEIDRRIKLLTQEKQTLAQRADVARRASRERLFGDGGANLLSIQAGLLANYSLLNAATGGLSGAVRFTVELDEAMRNLQAIVRVTDTDLGVLKQSLVEISEQTKFTSVEVANAAVTLGQAGFSVSEIQASISAVGLLATATGTELSRAVDIATSTLGVFKLESSEMANVANVMTEAVNTSKLNIEKLTLGLQYSGNIASQSGVRFEELTAALGAMANAGIRSGSTLGTGMRQILIALQKPSKEFRSTLERLGVSMDDIDVRSQGLYGALKNLSDAGFSSGDAIRSFQVRAAAAYNALSNNLDQMLDLESSFQDTNASIAANESQMKSLANQGRRLAGILGAVAATGLEPLKNSLITVTRLMGDWLSVTKETPTALQGIAIVLTSILGLFAVKRFASLTLGVIALAGGFRTLSGELTTAGRKWVTFQLFTKSMLRGQLGLKSLALGIAGLLGPWNLALAAVGAGIAAYSLFGRTTETTAKKIEKLQTAFDNSNGAAEETKASITSLDNQLSELLSRYDRLKTDQALLSQSITNVKRQFINLGRDASGVGEDVDTLIASLKELRIQLSKEYKLDLENAGLDLAALQVANKTAQAEAQQNINAQVRKIPNGPRQAFQKRFPVLGTGDPLSRDEASTLRVQLKQFLQDLDNGKAGANLPALDRRALRTSAELLIPALDKLAEVQTDGVNLQKDAAENARKQAVAADGANPQVAALLAQSEELRLSSKKRVSGSIKDSTNGALERERLAKGAADAENQRIFQLTQDVNLLRRNGTITSAETMATIRNNLAQARGEIDAFLLGISEEAGEVRDAVADSQIDSLQTQIRTAGQDMKAATDAAGVNDARRRQFDLIGQYNGARLAQIAASDEDPLVQDEQRKTLKQEILARRAAVRKEADDLIEAFLKELKDSREERFEKFSGNQTELDELKEDRAALLEIQNQARLDFDQALYAAAKESIEILDEQERKLRDVDGRTAELVDLSEKLQTQLRYIPADEGGQARSALTDLITQLNEAIEKGETLSELDLSSLERGFGSIGSVIGALFRPFEGQAEAAGRGILDLIAQVEGTAKGSNPNARGYNTTLGYGKYTGGPRDLVNMSVGEILKLQGEMLKNPENLATYRDASGKRGSSALGRYQFVRSTLQPLLKDLGIGMDEKFSAQLQDRLALELIRRLGNDPAKIAATWEGFTKTKTPLSTIAEATGQQTIPKRDDIAEDQRINAYSGLAGQLNARVQQATLGLENGTVGQNQAFGSISQVLKEANVALAERVKLVNDLVNKAGKTKEEEAELVRLTEERGDLLDFIKTTEEELLLLKGQQGIIQFNLTKSVQDWAKENLNMASAMQNGVGGVLSSIQGGFAQLFTDLSNEPKKAGQAFLQFGATVARAMQTALAEMMAVWLMQKLIGAIFPGGQKAGSFGAAARGFAGLKKAHGGEVPRASGFQGLVPGGNNAVRDRIPILAMPGEYILRRSAAQMIGRDNLDQMNAMGNRRMASGGHIGAGSKMASGLGGGPKNMWLVDERRQAPIPGPNDIVTIISDDLSTNGPTAQLVNMISNGG